MTILTTKIHILSLLKEHPYWISAFACGEGSFTGSVWLSTRAMWGMWPQCEFNITQSMQDKALLEAMNEYFNNSGGVYKRKNGIGTLSFRDLNALNSEIIPYFDKYPPIGLKAAAYDQWKLIVDLVSAKKHIGSQLEARDTFIDLLDKYQELNKRDTLINNRKLMRNKIMLKWLTNLKTVPTLQQKLELIKLTKEEMLDG